MKKKKISPQHISSFLINDDSIYHVYQGNYRIVAENGTSHTFDYGGIAVQKNHSEVISENKLTWKEGNDFFLTFLDIEIPPYESNKEAGKNCSERLLLNEVAKKIYLNDDLQFISETPHPFQLKRMDFSEDKVVVTYRFIEKKVIGSGIILKDGQNVLKFSKDKQLTLYRK